MRPFPFAAVAALAFVASAQAQQPYQMPPDAERCPSKWGANDQRGSANWMKPETVMRATRLIKTGEHFELGAVLTPDPKETFINEGRQFNVYTKNNRPLPNARVINEELIEIGRAHV